MRRHDEIREQRPVARTRIDLAVIAYEAADDARARRAPTLGTYGHVIDGFDAMPIIDGVAAIAEARQALESGTPTKHG
jgi:hypothetical protein